MKVIAWNCCKSFDRKFDHLAGLGADIAVVPESSADKPQAASLSDEQWLFVGDPKHGLGIVAFGEYRLERVDIADLPSYMLPVRVFGPTSFNLVGVWTKGKGYSGYTRALDAGFKKLQAFIQSTPRTIIAGDWNSNSVFDEHCGTSNHSAIVKSLDGLGLVSAYHRSFNEEHGKESRPTFHMQKKLEEPHHLDYVFVPRSARISSVDVGAPDAARGARRHRHVLVHRADDGEALPVM